LQVKKYKKSQQREKILELLKSTDQHPTADWVYEHLKKEFPKLSLGNVYRNLNILVEQGRIRELNFGSTFDRYDAHIEEHYHFICKKCGAIYDLELPYERSADRQVAEMIGGKVEFHQTEYYGICLDCLKEQTDNNK